MVLPLAEETSAGEVTTEVPVEEDGGSVAGALVEEPVAGASVEAEGVSEVGAVSQVPMEGHEGSEAYINPRVR